MDEITLSPVEGVLMRTPNRWLLAVASGSATAGLMIVGAPAAQATEESPATQYVAPEFDPASAVSDTDVADGTARACGNYITGAPFGAGYVESLPGCSFIGTTPSTKYQYSWSQYQSDGTACVQGLGYSRNAGGTYVPGWSSVGCGTGGNALAPWGNVSAVSKVRTLAIGGPNGVKIIWS